MCDLQSQDYVVTINHNKSYNYLYKSSHYSEGNCSVQYNLSYLNLHYLNPWLSKRYYEFRNPKRQFNFLHNQVINGMLV